jgi:arylsulfatase A-like enzyme
MKVLVLHASALHLGYVGCYGNEWVDTPALDRLAAEGIVFDQHHADCPAARTAWTGRYRFPHPDGPAPDAAAALPALLAMNEVPFTLVRPPDTVGEDETALEQTLGAALDAIEYRADSPRWLVWVDLPPLLPPWTAPQDLLDRYLSEGEVDETGDEDDAEDEDEAETDDAPEEEQEPLTPWLDPPAGPIDVDDLFQLDRLQSSYAAAVAFLDDALGRLLDELREGRLLDEMTVIVTGDRGLALGEHGHVGDWRPWPHDELIHLPLIVRLPGAEEAGRRVFALTQPVDLLPTLLDLIGLAAPPDLHGHTLLPLARGQAEKVREYACVGVEGSGAMAWALRTPEWGLVLPLRVPEGDPPRGPQLYVKPDDRWEVNDVVQHRLELAESLEKVLRGFVEATRRPGPLEIPPLAEPVQG